MSSSYLLESRANAFESQYRENATLHRNQNAFTLVLESVEHPAL